MVRIEIFYPTLKGYSAHKKTTVKDLTRIFNGMTVLNNNEGYWIDQNKKLVKDKIAVFLIFSQGITKDQVLRLLKVIDNIKADLNQECVAFSLDNKIFFR